MTLAYFELTNGTDDEFVAAQNASVAYIQVTDSDLSETPWISRRSYRKPPANFVESFGPGEAPRKAEPKKETPNFDSGEWLEMLKNGF